MKRPDLTLFAVIFSAASALASALLSFVSLYATLSKPRLGIDFWSGPKGKALPRSFAPDSDERFYIRLKNEGGNWFGPLSPRNPSITHLMVLIYFPNDFEPQQIWRYEDPTMRDTTVFRASPSGVLGSMRYMAVPAMWNVRPPTISMLSYQEHVIIVVRAHTPLRPGKYIFKIQAASDEGGLGLFSLPVVITGGGGTS